MKIITEEHKDGEIKGIETVAMNMLIANKSVEEISKLTGLPEKAIIELRKEIGTNE